MHGEVGKKTKSVGLRERAGCFGAAKGGSIDTGKRESHAPVIAEQGTIGGR